MVDMQDARYQALVLANSVGATETVDQTLERAKKYAKFLEGRDKEEEPTP